MYVGCDSSKEQNAGDVSVHITIMAHDDESPAKHMNFTKTASKYITDAASGIKEDLRSCPDRRNTESRT